MTEILLWDFMIWHRGLTIFVFIERAKDTVAPRVGNLGCHTKVGKWDKPTSQ